jgi:hypothetical protein
VAPGKNAIANLIAIGGGGGGGECDDDSPILITGSLPTWISSVSNRFYLAADNAVPPDACPHTEFRVRIKLFNRPEGIRQLVAAMIPIHITAASMTSAQIGIEIDTGGILYQGVIPGGASGQRADIAVSNITTPPGFPPGTISKFVQVMGSNLHPLVEFPVGNSTQGNLFLRLRLFKPAAFDLPSDIIVRVGPQIALYFGADPTEPEANVHQPTIAEYGSHISIINAS